jgi:hypothetical protein
LLQVHKTTAVQQLLEEFQAYNQNIVFNYQSIGKQDTSMDNIKRVVPKELTP